MDELKGMLKQINADIERLALAVVEINKRFSSHCVEDAEVQGRIDTGLKKLEQEVQAILDRVTRES